MTTDEKLIFEADELTVDQLQLIHKILHNRATRFSFTEEDGKTKIYYGDVFVLECQDTPERIDALVVGTLRTLHGTIVINEE